ncbi:MAG: hypothetical protein J0L88_07370 [Xanthomonadales bacterium]|nr:hypothetical protein [Xanthomonadales bacterium]
MRAEQPDTSFNGNGRYVYGPTGTLAFRAVANLPLPDGRIVAVFQFPTFTGFCAEPRCITLARFDANGTLEQVATFANGLQEVTAAALDSSGRVVVVAQTTAGANGRDIHVARFLPASLSRDLGFAGGTGWTRVSYNTQDEYPAAVAIDAQDRIVVAGSFALSATDTDFGLLRLRSDGTLDTGFDGTGRRRVAFDLSGSLLFDQANAVAIANDGDIIAVGTAFDAAASRVRAAITRLRGDGSYEASFCADACAFNTGYSAIRQGRTVYQFGAATVYSDEGLAIDAIAAGGYVIAGATYADDGSNRRGVLARFNDAGGFAAERIGASLGDNGVFHSVRVADGTGSRFLVAGNSGPSDNFLLVQAYDAFLQPVAGYGNCHPQDNGFCPIFGTASATTARTSVAPSSSMPSVARCCRHRVSRCRAACRRS